jgi:class 3 adenylate cyclase/tetratricopeptide (TPR) repeat protein
MTRATVDLAEWLDGLGLGRYAQTFAENNIEFSILLDLTEDDLTKLGVASLGHRKTLLKAIKAMTAPSHPAGTVTSASSVGVPSPLSEHHEAEFRHITILFVDLVGSTRLSEQLDPQDLKYVIEAYREACSAAVRNFGGEVARLAGDGVMAIFKSHEDAAARATHAALEIVTTVPKISGPTVLACRVGISSGPVVVGDIGDGGPLAMDALGETPNIAARLQTLADPNAVLISDSTRRLISAGFELKELGLRELKGVTEPLQVYAVLSAKNAASRFEAMHAGSLATLVGRTSELSLLLDRWNKVKGGDGQVIVLSGIPGVGKSRLIHELRSNIQAEPHSLLCYQGSPYHSQSPLAPVIGQMQHAAQLVTREADTDKLAKLDAYLPHVTGRHQEQLSLIAKLLSIPMENDAGLSGLTSQQVKNKTISMLADMLLAFADQQPTLCILEDLHWMDPTTIELITLMISRIERARVLLVVSCRPDFRPAWIDYANTTTLSLTRMSHTEVKTMIQNLSAGGTLPLAVVDQIIEKADGVPLFIEELTSSTLGALSSRGAVQRKDPPTSLRVPDTLSDALMERLDRVAPSRRLAQVAAAIGREFSEEILLSASQIDKDDMQLALSQLQRADIIHQVDVWPLIRYAFKHALLRDVIHEAMLRSKRQQIHADIAASIEKDFRELAESQPEVLAYHYQEAAHHQQAIRCWAKAGQRALGHSANVEAIANFRNALRLLNALPETPERTKQEIDVQLALGIPLIAVKGYASEETRDAFSRARDLCLRLGNIPEYFQSLFGEWGFRWMKGNNEEALPIAQEFLVRSQALSDPVLRMVAHRMMGSTLLTIGDFQSSANHFEETIKLSRSEGQRMLSGLYMVEPQVASLLLLSWASWIMGYPDRALARVSEALVLARDLDHPYSIAFAHYMTSVVFLWRGDATLALEHAERSFEISNEQRFSLYAILSRISRGRALGDLGQLREAQAEIARGLHDARDNGVGFMLPMMNSWLAEIHARAGENEIALSIVEKSLAEMRGVSGKAWEAELHRQKADILVAINLSRVEEAETHFVKAIEVARHQHAMSLELRAATSLAELRRTQGKVNEAQALLEAIFCRFEEGIDTAGLKRARDVQRTLR